MAVSGHAAQHLPAADAVRLDRRHLRHSARAGGVFQKEEDASHSLDPAPDGNRFGLCPRVSPAFGVRQRFRPYPVARCGRIAPPGTGSVPGKNGHRNRRGYGGFAPRRKHRRLHTRSCHRLGHRQAQGASGERERNALRARLRRCGDAGSGSAAPLAAGVVPPSLGRRSVAPNGADADPVWVLGFYAARVVAAATFRVRYL
jgi:hypothetical protein